MAIVEILSVTGAVSPLLPTPPRRHPPILCKEGTFMSLVDENGLNPIVRGRINTLCVRSPDPQPHTRQGAEVGVVNCLDTLHAFKSHDGS